MAKAIYTISKTDKGTYVVYFFETGELREYEELAKLLRALAYLENKEGR